MKIWVANLDRYFIPFTIEIASLAQVDDEGNRIVYEGDYSLEFSRGHGDILRVKGTIDLDGAETKVPARVYPKRHF